MDDSKKPSGTPEERAFQALIRTYMWRNKPAVATGEGCQFFQFDDEMWTALAAYLN